MLALEGESLEWRTLRRDGPTVIHVTRLTEFITPRIEAFNLLGESVSNHNEKTNKLIMIESSIIFVEEFEYKSTREK